MALRPFVAVVDGEGMGVSAAAGVAEATEKVARQD
jgi:hypothetical protein